MHTYDYFYLMVLYWLYSRSKVYYHFFANHELLEHVVNFDLYYLVLAFEETRRHEGLKFRGTFNTKYIKLLKLWHPKTLFHELIEL